MANFKVASRRRVFVVSASAQQQTQGFAVERFYPSGISGRRVVCDGRPQHQRVASEAQSHSPAAMREIRSRSYPVSLFIDVGLAATYHRYRLYLESPRACGRLRNANCQRVGTNPDSISDTRVGFDALLFGKPGDARFDSARVRS